MPIFSSSKYTLQQLVRDAWQFVRPYKKSFIVATCLRIAGDIVWLYPALAIGLVVTHLSLGADSVSLGYLYGVLALWFVAIIIRLSGQTGAKYLNNHLAEKVKIDMEMQLMQHLSRLSLTWHEQEHSGGKMKRITRGAESMMQVLKIFINNIIEIGVNFIGMPFILWQYDPAIAVATILFLIIFFFTSRALTRPATQAAQRVSHTEEDAQGIVFEVMNNIRTVKVLSMESGLLLRLQERANQLRQEIHQRIFYFQKKNLILNLMSYSCRFFAIGYIIYGILHGRFEVGFLVTFYTYYHRMWESINELADITETIGIARYNVALAMGFLREPLPTTPTHPIAFPADWQTIRFDHVSFSYGEVEALRDVSFSVRRGEKIGLVGSSGAGKSTLFKMFLKELSEYDGQIFVDEIPFSHIDRASYLDRAAVVLQETEVFNFSLQDNITLTSNNPVEESHLKEALDVSHVSGFLHKLPLGVDTPIGEKGIKLSGGEKQRLGIARAVYKRPDIFFLDEATSHLDLESEEYIQKSLHQVFDRVTAIVIAHRLTTVQQMDRILVLEHGQIVEQGSFADLMKQEGRFFELWQKQNL